MDEVTEVRGTAIALDVAQAEFARFVDEWDIDDNVDAMSGEDRESFEQVQSRIIRQIVKGLAEVKIKDFTDVSVEQCIEWDLIVPNNEEDDANL